MMNKRRAKLKNGDARKMKMGGDYMEPSKEVKFGGPSRPMKYTQGGEKKEGDKTRTNASADYINRSRGRTKAQIAKDKSNAEMAKEADKRMAELKNKAASEFYTRGQVGTPKKKPANTTSGIEGVGRPTQQGGNTNRATSKSSTSKSDVANFPAFGPAPKGQRSATKTSTPKKKPAAKAPSTPKSARGAMMGNTEKKSANSVSQNKPTATLQKSTTKNVAADLPKSKTASRIDRRAQQVTNRKTSRAKSAEAGASNKAEAAANRKKEAASRPTRMDRKAARMNKRADRVEARKEKKADVNAAKARLKAARRLQSGGMKTPTEDQKGLKKLPTSVRNKMGYKKYGGKK